jgi:predicted Zn-dependent protease
MVARTMATPLLHKHRIALASVVLLIFAGCAVPNPRSLSASEHASLFTAEYGEVTNPHCYAALVRLVGLSMSSSRAAPRLLLVNTGSALALSPSPDLVVISRGMIELLPTEGELLFIMAHEIGHSELEHHTRSPESAFALSTRSVQEQEISADGFALARLTGAGYPATTAISALQRTYTAPSNLKALASSSEYPSLTDRTSAILHQASSNQSALLTSRPRPPIEHREYRQCRAELLQSGLLEADGTRQ